MLTAACACLLTAVGAADRARIDQYFTSVREVEQQLGHMLEKPAPAEACLVPKEPGQAELGPTWEVAEKKVQAYVNLRDYELLLKQLNDKTARPPQVISVVVPYTYAVVATTVTYLLHTFCGRKPMFQVGAYKDESMEATQKMEQVLQYQADHARMIKQFYRWFNEAPVLLLIAIVILVVVKPF